AGRAGEVAARSGQSRYEAGGNRVARQREDDWDDRSRVLCRENRLGPIRHNHIDLEPDELGCDLGGAFIATLRPAILDRDIPPLAPAQLTQPLQKAPVHWLCVAAVPEPRNPMVGSLPCSARAASGHAAAAPSSVMNSRRFIAAIIRSPRRRGRAEWAGW